MVQQIKLLLLASYYLVAIWFMALTATLRRWRYNVHMWKGSLRGRGGKDLR